MIYLCVGLILVSVIGTICLMLFTPMKDIVYKNPDDNLDSLVHIEPTRWKRCLGIMNSICIISREY